MGTVAGGDDVYFGPPLSLGSGNANGVGVLANVGGDDRYVAVAEPVLGAASFSQEWYDACVACRAVPTAGVFIDIGGNDSYEVPTTNVGRRNGGAWVDNRSPPVWDAIEHGGGLDVAKGQLLLP